MGMVGGGRGAGNRFCSRINSGQPRRFGPTIRTRRRPPATNTPDVRPTPGDASGGGWHCGLSLDPQRLCLRPAGVARRQDGPKPATPRGGRLRDDPRR
jgi:hypothetical protein